MKRVDLPTLGSYELADYLYAQSLIKQYNETYKANLEASSISPVTQAVTTWHKPIGEIATEASEAGFLIADIKEPVPLPKMQDLSPRDYDTLVKIPNFVIFKLFKP